MEVTSCEVPPQTLYSTADVHRIRSKELLDVQVGYFIWIFHISTHNFWKSSLKRRISNHWIISVLHDVHYENEYS